MSRQKFEGDSRVLLKNVIFFWRGPRKLSLGTPVEVLAVVVVIRLMFCMKLETLSLTKNILFMPRLLRILGPP